MYCLNDTRRCFGDLQFMDLEWLTGGKEVEEQVIVGRELAAGACLCNMDCSVVSSQSRPFPREDWCWVVNTSRGHLGLQVWRICLAPFFRSETLNASNDSRDRDEPISEHLRGETFRSRRSGVTSSSSSRRRDVQWTFHRGSPGFNPGPRLIHLVRASTTSAASM